MVMRRALKLKLKNFVSVQQNAGEVDRDYLKRVEQLIRNLKFFNHTNDDVHTALQAARSNLTLVIAVSGLR